MSVNVRSLEASGGTPEGAILRAKSLLKRLRWLSPTSALSSAPSSNFGRNIERELLHLSEHDGVMMLKLRKRDAAVVMSVEHYEEMLQMKEACARVIEAESEAAIMRATQDFDALYSRIASPASQRAADDLFSATGKELGQTYKPGKTEVP